MNDKWLIEIKERAKNNHIEFNKLLKELRNFLEGKVITINSDTFNGQPFGVSKPKMKGVSFLYDRNIFVYFSKPDGEPYIQPPNTNDSLYLSECIITPAKAAII